MKIIQSSALLMSALLLLLWETSCERQIGNSPGANLSPPLIAKAGDTWTRPVDGMEMVYVPAGAFPMGSTDAEMDATLAACIDCRKKGLLTALTMECGDCQRHLFNHEQPRHTVYLDGFWIDKTEVTIAQYRKCVEAGACQAVGNQAAVQPNDPLEILPDNPVRFVSWHNARDYATWVGGRLPTEAEWEKAARGTDSRIYPWGNGTPDCGKANYGNCAPPLPVGHYPLTASPYGALDMAGNLWEWTNDWYEERYYDRSPARNPKGPDQGQYRVVRGGSSGDTWLGIRCAARRHGSPANRFPEIGFRTVIVP